MKHSDSIYSSLKHLLFTVVFLLGFHGIGHSVGYPSSGSEKHTDTKESIDSGNKLLEIEAILKRHDTCKNGRENPDSAVVYTIEALQMAEACFGMNSETYIDIFCDYMLEDVGNHNPTLNDYLFPFVTTALDQESKYVWKAFYALAYKMKDAREFDNAVDLFERVIASDCKAAYKYSAQINLAEIKYHFKNENPEPMLTSLIKEIEKEDYPCKGELNFMLANVMADYYSDIEDYDKLIDIAEFGEKNAEYVSSHDLIILLSKMKEAYLPTNHIKAIECLDRIIELADQTTVKTQSDRHLLTLSLIQRGDYSRSHSLDFSSALDYYLRALDISTDSFTTMDRFSLFALQRLNSIASDPESDETTLELGELLLDRVGDEILIRESPEFILSIVNAYINAGKISNAELLLNKCQSVIDPDTKSAHRAILYQAAIELKKNNCAEAINYLESLMSMKLDNDIKLSGLKYLKKAYARLEDSKADAISDSINMITKKAISENIKLVSPILRSNWIKVCEESISSLLGDADNASSIKNALALNLFKKNLMLRTTSSIKRHIIENHSPNYKGQLASIQNDLVKAINRGDSLETIRLRKEYDIFEQSAVSEFLGNHSILQDIDVKIDDVLDRLDNNSIAVDFLYISYDRKMHLGAFVFSKQLNPKYIPLFSYEDAFPTDSINRIWNKIIPLTEGYKDLYFCGDGPINSLPIEYAKVIGNKNIADYISPHRVFHLSEINSSSNIGDKIGFVGVADHNGSRDGVESNWRGNWTDLPNVKTELETLTTHFSSDSLLILLNETATEQAFKALDEADISTLHISTHGVFRNEKALIEASMQPASDDYYIAKRILSVNETSLSAIILHEGNKFWKSPYLENEMDDILTSSEIEMLHFPNLRLTVLSACDTGLGEIDSDGVRGLQRAFRIAGAKSLICSLAKVDDYWTAQFMDAFYEQAAQGRSIYDSFQSAQRWLRSELPDNPEIWSSFILIE